ncbi:MAG: hypothetical protein M3Q94_14650 [Pseudomonadota bacterium]|nr:hypothetical protein [Pseudomonadota bacterium]
MIASTEITNVANESLDAMQCSREYLRWLSSLGAAIQTDLTTGKGFIAKDLAGLVQYLADDHCNVLDCQIGEFNEKLNALELRT